MERVKRISGYQGGLWWWRGLRWIGGAQRIFRAEKYFVWYYKGGYMPLSAQFHSVVQSWLTLCDPMDWSTPGFPVHQQLLSLLKLMSTESVMPTNHLILCHPFLLLASIFPSIRVFSNESALHIRWPKYWSFSFNISPSNEHPGLISFMMDWWDLLEYKGLSRVFSKTTVQKHQFFGTQRSL